MIASIQEDWRSFLSGCFAILVVAGIFLSSLPDLYQVGLVVSGSAMAGCALLGDSRNRRASLGFSGIFFIGAILTLVPIPLIGAVVVLYNARKNCLRTTQSTIFARVGAVVAVSIASVVGIFVWWGQSGGGIFYTQLPAVAYESPVILFGFVMLGSLVNAVFEEGLWRRHLFLQMNFVRRTILRVTILSILFGSVHYFALPGGWDGVMLTTLFSVAASWLVHLSGGRLGLAILAHWIADVSLLSLVVGVVDV